MPILVDEVVISVDVEAPAAGGGRGREGAPAAAAASEDRQAIVAECVERVLDILAQREER